MPDAAPDPAYEHVRRVKERHADALLAISGVTGVGVAFQEAPGAAGRRLAIRVYVRRKGDFPPGREIPDRIEGVPVDVVEAAFRPLAGPAAPAPTPAGALAALPADPDAYNPLVGGISAASQLLPDEGGTAGLVVRCGLTGEGMLLSNFHVFCGRDGTGSPGDPVCQPAGGSVCATLTRFYAGNLMMADGRAYGVDGAVAAVDPAAREWTLAQVEELGPVSGAGTAALGMQVVKRGCATLLTCGSVDSLDTDMWLDVTVTRSILLRNQLSVVSSGDAFASFGDSGSVVVDTATRRVVGLLGAMGFDAAHSSNYWTANPIAAVLAALQAGIE